MQSFILSYQFQSQKHKSPNSFFVNSMTFDPGSIIFPEIKLEERNFRFKFRTKITILSKNHVLNRRTGVFWCSKLLLAKLGANSEIIGNFRILEKFSHYMIPYMNHGSRSAMNVCLYTRLSFVCKSLLPMHLVPQLIGADSVSDEQPGRVMFRFPDR